MTLGIDEVIMALVIAMQSNASIPPADMVCMARNIYHEARGEDYEGQLAVGYVTINRTEAAGFGSTICQTVYQDGQFSWTQDGLSDVIEDWDAFNTAMWISVDVFLGYAPDPTGGATYYFNPHKSSPIWALSFNVTADIGAHRFLEE